MGKIEKNLDHEVPTNWRKKVVTRSDGIRKDVYVYDPSGKVFRSRKSLLKHLKTNKLPFTLEDFFPEAAKAAADKRAVPAVKEDAAEMPGGASGGDTPTSTKKLKMQPEVAVKRLTMGSEVTGETAEEDKGVAAMQVAPQAEDKQEPQDAEKKEAAKEKQDSQSSRKKPQEKGAEKQEGRNEQRSLQIQNGKLVGDLRKLREECKVAGKRAESLLEELKTVHGHLETISGGKWAPDKDGMAMVLSQVGDVLDMINSALERHSSAAQEEEINWKVLKDRHGRSLRSRARNTKEEDEGNKVDKKENEANGDKA